MKNRLLLLFAALFLGLQTLSAQAPQGFNYQCIVRDAANQPIVNQTAQLIFSLREGDPNGPIAYAETHTTSTNDYGLINLVVGQGTPTSGAFNSIDWASSAKYLKVFVQNGPIATELGTTQLMSVPYALYAANGGGGNGDDWGNQTVATDGTLEGDGLPASPLRLPEILAPGVFGSAGEVPVIQVDATGRVIGISSVPVAGGISYTAGTGITISPANVISNTGDTNAADDLTTASTAAGDVTGPFANLQIAAAAVGSAELANNAVGTGKIANSAVTGAKIAQSGATNGQVLEWNGTTWAPANDDNGGGSVSITEGAGIDVGGSNPNFTITNTGDLDPADDLTTSSNAAGDVTGPFANLQIAAAAVGSAELANNAVGTAKIANSAVTGAKIAQAGATNGQVLKWNGSAWAPADDATGGGGVNITGGAGISIDGSNPNFTVNNTGDVNPADDVTNVSAADGDVSGVFSNLQIKAGAVGTTEIANGAVTGTKIAQNGAANGQVLKWNGSAWAPADDAAGGGGVNITAGAGISIDGSNPNFTVNNTGDLSNTNEIQTLSLNGAVLSLSNGGGSVNLPAATDAQTLSLAGNALSISNGNTVTLPAETDGSVTNELQTLSLTGADLSLSNGGGTVTLPQAPVYAAGTGISITGSNPNYTIANTGDLNPADDLTTASTAAGDVTGPFANLQIAPNAVSSPEIADQAVGSTEIANGSIQSGDLSALGATASGQILTWNGSAWNAAAPSPSNTIWTTGPPSDVAHNVPAINTVILATDTYDYATYPVNTTFVVDAGNHTGAAYFSTDTAVNEVRVVTIAVNGTGSLGVNPIGLSVQNQPALDSGTGIEVKANGTGIKISNSLVGLNVKSSSIGTAAVLEGGFLGAAASGSFTGVQGTATYDDDAAVGVVGDFGANGPYDGTGVAGRSVPELGPTSSVRGYGFGGSFFGGHRGLRAEQLFNNGLTPQTGTYSKPYGSPDMSMAGHFVSASSVGLLAESSGQHIYDPVNFAGQDSTEARPGLPPYGIGVVGISNAPQGAKRIGVLGYTTNPSFSFGGNVGVMGHADGLNNIGVQGIADDGYGGVFTSNSGPAALVVNQGNMGIGTFEPQARLQINSNSGQPQLRLHAPGSFNGQSIVQFSDWISSDVWQMNVRPTDSPVFDISHTNSFSGVTSTLLRIKPEGQVGINTGILDPAPYTLRINQAMGFGLALFNGPVNNWELYVSGTSLFFLNNLNITAWLSTSGQLVTSSDARYKKNWQPLGSALDQVRRLNPVTYELAAENNGRRYVGFIAQEVQAVAPELVEETTLRETGETRLGVNYPGFGVLAIKAIQEQQGQLDALQQENTALKTELASLRAQQTALEERLSRLEQALSAPGTPGVRRD